MLIRSVLKARTVFVAEVWGESHPSMSTPLVHLGYVYARTGRVVEAEGFFRQSLKLLRVSVDGTQVGAPPANTSPSDVHPSCVALAAWRFAQLLSVMPRRETETQRCVDVANASWEAWGQGRGGETIEDQLGTLNALSGQGHHGKLFTSSITLGRAVPGRVSRL